MGCPVSFDVKEQRKRREELLRIRMDKVFQIKRIIKDNILAFDRVINFEEKSILGDAEIRSQLLKILRRRLSDVSKVLSESIEKAFVTFLMPIPSEDVRPRSPDKLDELLQLDYVVKELDHKWSSNNTDANSFEGDQKIDRMGLESEERAGLRVDFDISTLQCSFYNMNGCLSSMRPIEFDWNVEKDFQSKFGKPFTLRFHIENMNIFVVEMKINLFIKFMYLLMSLDTSELERIVSRKFHIRVGDVVVVREGERGDGQHPKNEEDFYEKINKHLLQSRSTCEYNKALIFSYIFTVFRGMIRDADLSYFRGSKYYYYVHWIEAYKKSNNYY